MVSLPCTKTTDQETASVVFQNAERRRRTKKNFTMIRNEILDDPNLTHGGKLTLITLISYCWFEKESCFPGQETLSARLHRSTRTIRRYLTELREKGYIRVCRRGLGRPNHYTITLPYGTDLTASERTPVSSLDRTPMSAESDEAKQIQVESDEALSKAQKEVDRTHQVYRRPGSLTTHKTEGETEEGRRSVSNQNPSTPLSTHPTTPNRAERSNNEPSPVRERPARRPLASGMSSIAEVMRNGTALPRPERRPEPARLTAPPLTQDELDKQGRGRAAFTRRAEVNPIDAIIPPEHQHILHRQFGAGAQTTTRRNKKQPVYEKLQLAIERISEELGDFQHVTSNITQAENIRREANADSEQFLVTLYEAWAVTKYAHTIGRINKQDSAGQPVKMPYFYAVLRQKAGITQKQGII